MGPTIRLGKRSAKEMMPSQRPEWVSSQVS
jgi:hypothetical protein